MSTNDFLWVFPRIAPLQFVSDADKGYADIYQWFGLLWNNAVYLKCSTSCIFVDRFALIYSFCQQLHFDGN